MTAPASLRPLASSTTNGWRKRIATIVRSAPISDMTSLMSAKLGVTVHELDFSMSEKAIISSSSGSGTGRNPPPILLLLPTTTRMMA